MKADHSPLRFKARETIVQKYNYQLEQFPKRWGELKKLNNFKKSSKLNVTMEDVV